MVFHFNVQLLKATKGLAPDETTFSVVCGLDSILANWGQLEPQPLACTDLGEVVTNDAYCKGTAASCPV